MAESTAENQTYPGDEYGRSFADVYDSWYATVTDAKATARFISDRCHTSDQSLNHPPKPRLVLELGVGSGRLAQPLCEAGLTVIGIDVSDAMLAGCRHLPSWGDGTLVPVQSDMRDLPFRSPSPTFDAILIGFNTLFNLLTSADQQQLFTTAANLVKPSGMLLVETTNHQTLDLTSAPQATAVHHSLGMTRRSDSSVVAASTNVHQRDQMIEGCHIECDDSGVTMRPWSLRWATTQEIDQMAKNAGLVCAERYADWEESLFDYDSQNCVSVYRK